MESDLKSIELISKKKIYNILRSDRNHYEPEIVKNKYEALKNISRQDLYDPWGSDSYKFICMDAAEGDLRTYKEYYYKWSFKKVYELYTLRLVCNYQEPLRKRN